MEIINNFSDVFFSVWKKGILGVDIFQILIGIGIFFIFLVFRGLISKLIIKKLEKFQKEQPINLMILSFMPWKDLQDFYQLFLVFLLQVII